MKFVKIISAIFLSIILFVVLIKQVKATSSDQSGFLKIIPLSINKSIYGFSINGAVSLENENSLVRVILVDNNNNEYLVYEAYPLITKTNSFTVNDACEETCILDTVTPTQLRIEGNNASFGLGETSIISNLGDLKTRLKTANLSEERIRFKATKDNLKIQKLNDNIKRKGKGWIAGETSVSKMTYQEKKNLFRKKDGTLPDMLPNLQGFEYYKGGIFEIPSDSQISPTGGGPGDPSPTPSPSPSISPPPPAPVRPSWDWRNVHGENWMTPVKDQGNVGTCFIFSAVGAMESAINLNFNQHLDIDLSEQMYADCINSFDPPLGMNPRSFPQCSGANVCYPGNDYCAFGAHGIADEACDPYAARGIYPSLNCDLNHICNNWQDRIWRLNDFYDYKFGSDRGTPNCPRQTMNPPEEDFKRALIQKGPMSSGVVSWGHAMVLVGYNNRSNWKTADHCDWNEFCNPINGCVTQECYNPGEEKTICVNEFGSNGDPSLLYTYKCEFWMTGKYRWVYQGYPKSPVSCGLGMKCINNTCQDGRNFSLTNGYRECTLFDGSYFEEFSEYDPGKGNNYWIFKNSWGPDWGENGYANIAASLENLGWGSLPIKPIPPSGNSYQTTCVDKDHDGYCNWGISDTKPTTCPSSCKPQKDCDDSNPILGTFDADLNCLSISRGDINGDGKIDIMDFRLLISDFGKNIFSLADLDQNGKVDLFDLNILIKNFGRVL